MYLLRPAFLGRSKKKVVSLWNGHRQDNNLQGLFSPDAQVYEAGLSGCGARALWDPAQFGTQE